MVFGKENIRIFYSPNRCSVASNIAKLQFLHVEILSMPNI
jgi:hypothetical protein